MFMMKSVLTQASRWTALAMGFLVAVGHLPAEPAGPGDSLVTVAGNGANGFAGDGGPALQASLSAPCAVVVDAAGNLFIADQNNSRIRKVDALGIITTVAGNGANTYAGDDGPARRAGLAAPCALAVDPAGDLFIADYFNSHIRKVDPHGLITTVAGNGANAFAGDGGPAAQASLSAPSAVAVDATGNLFIADENNYRVRKVDPQGIITTVAGNGTNSFSGDGWLAVEAGLSAPKGVAVDPAGNLYIADENNHRIRRVDKDGFIHTVAGSGTAGYSGDGGPATAAGLFYPCSLAVDARGNLYFADAGTPRVRRVDPHGIITTVAGNGTIGFAGDGGPATAAALANPQGVAVDANGRLWLADQGNNRIRAVPPPPAPLPLPPPVVVALPPTNTPVANTSPAHTNATSAPVALELVIATNTVAKPTNQVVVAPRPPAVTPTNAVKPAVAARPAFIYRQPVDQTAAIGGRASFSVAAGGPPGLGYQWYFRNPTDQRAAGARAEIAGVYVIGTAVTNAGADYDTAPAVRFDGGGGTGAGGVAVVSNGLVTRITLTNAGSGYTRPPDIVIDPPGRPLPGQTNGTLELDHVTTNDFGGYYVVLSTPGPDRVASRPARLLPARPPLLRLPPADQTAPPGTVVKLNVAADGSPPLGYQWWLTADRPRRAAAKPRVTNGLVQTTKVTDGGAGYLTTPAVRFTGGNGAGAEGVAVVSNRVVTAIRMIHPGVGYTRAPVVEIDPPAPLRLPRATTPEWMFVAAPDTSAGNYCVVVTNLYGCVTSPPARVTVTAPGGSSGHWWKLF